MSRAAARGRWEHLIAVQADSGLSVAEFCRREEISQASFYQWRKKLGVSQLETFVPVSVVDSAAVEVEFPCGAVLRVPAGAPQTLEHVVSLLLVAEDQA